MAQEELAVTAPEVLADSLGEYLRAWGKRIRSGESGAVPVIAGLVLIVIFFQIEQSTFLSAGNLVNLFVQAALFILFAAAEIYALLLSEIDLSVGAVAGVGGFVIAELIAPPVNLVWWLGIAGGLLVCAAIGLLQGTLITRLHLPSFIVTLGGLLGLTGVIIELAHDRQDGRGRRHLDQHHQPGLQPGQREHEHHAQLDRPDRHPGGLRVRVDQRRGPAASAGAECSSPERRDPEGALAALGGVAIVIHLHAEPRRRPDHI